jgi:hypothetical protein
MIQSTTRSHATQDGNISHTMQTLTCAALGLRQPKHLNKWGKL